MQSRFSKTINSLASQRRDPRYLFTIIFSSIVFILCFLQVKDAGLFDSVERPVFQFFNNLPDTFYDVVLAITQLGGLGGLVIWVPVAWYLVNKRAALTVLGTGISAWLLAKVAKGISQRGRPLDFLDNINLFDAEKLGGYGFPSGHSTFSAAVITVLYYQVAPRYRKYLLASALLVGLSRMYLGAHFPLDVVGGWALGALVGGLAVMLVGVSNKGISAVRLKSFLNKRGYRISHLTFANVDARGSRPVFITTDKGEEYFGKLFGKQEHAADWLFKIFRFFRYKNLQAEEPHMSSRRNVEIEAFAMLWAKQAGVRIAKVIDILQYGSYWISIQQKVDATQLDQHSRLLQRSLEDTWRQVAKLHKANIAHRDLRAANVMVDKKGQAYLIDFGFAEISASSSRRNMDTAELLMSMSLVVGVDRTVKAASAVLDNKDLARALPYLQTAVFSGATTKLLKADRSVLKDLKAELHKKLGIKEEVEQVDIVRFNKRKIFNLVLFAIFVYVIAPQFKVFNDALSQSQLVSVAWLIPLAVASLLTYVSTGAVYVSLASVPLKLREASLVQLAASFVSKIAPGGIGSATLNARYLTKSGLESLETSAIITGQAVIGFIMFIIPLGIFLALNGTNVLNLIDVQIRLVYVFLAVGLISVAALLTYFVDKIRTTVTERVTQAIEGIRENSTPARELTVAALSSLTVTALYIFCLYAALQAVGVHPGITVVIVAYALAVIAKSAVPAPGGLGPVEAALIATLISFGTDKSAAVAAVLLYRLATFWIPIPFSLAAYRFITKRRLV